MKYLKKKKFIFLTLIVISFPFINFFQNNIPEFTNKFYYLSLINLFIINLTLTFLISLSFKILIKTNFYETLLSISLINLTLLFLFKLLYQNIVPPGQFRGEIIFILSLVIIFFILKFNPVRFFLVSFCVIYLIINFFNSVFINSENILEKNETDKIFKNIDKNIIAKNNVYFVIFDAAVSRDLFEKNFNLKIKNEKFANLIEFKNIKPFSNSTINSMTNLFNLNYKTSNKVLFPNILKEKHITKTNLYRFIKEENFNFYFFGNSKINCESYNLKLCINKKLNNIKLFYFNTVEIAQELFYQTFYDIFYKKISIIFNLNFIKDNKYYYELYKTNLPLKNFFQENKSSYEQGKNFYLIYNYIPHEPYIYNNKCEFKNIAGNENMENINFILDGYQNNYLCMIETIEEFVNSITKFDPKANVLIFADHGFPISRENLINGSISSDQDILVLSYKNKNCKKNNFIKKEILYDIILNTFVC